MKILFVCTGNTCRSCMAEGIFNYKIKNISGGIDAEADSAGIYANNGESASENSIKVLKDKFNINISMHSAKSINKELIKFADIVLTMTRNHKSALVSMFPDAALKTYTLIEYVSDNPVQKDMEKYDYRLDIPDPYGMSAEMYKKCAESIECAVDKLIEMLKRSNY